MDLHCLTDPGPPGPPDKVAVDEITDSTAQLSWTLGRDNGSPITGYIIQARTPFTVGWQAVDTGIVERSPLSLYNIHLDCILGFSLIHLSFESSCATTWFSKEHVSNWQCRRWSTVTR